LQVGSAGPRVLVMILVSLGCLLPLVSAPEDLETARLGLILLNFFTLQDLTQMRSIVAVPGPVHRDKFYVVFISLLCFCRSDHAADCTPAVVRSASIFPLILAPTVLSVWLAVGLGPCPLGLINAPAIGAILALLGVLGLVARRLWQCSVRYTPFPCDLVSISADTAWFLPYWYMFVMGDLASRCLRRELPERFFWGYLILVALAFMLSVGDGAGGKHTGSLASTTAMATAVAILLLRQAWSPSCVDGKPLSSNTSV